VSFPTGPGPNNRRLPRKHILGSIHASLRRLRTDYVDLLQAHRYDCETPLEETMQAFADGVHAGKAHYIGVSEWRAEEIRAAAGLARELGSQLVSNQPQYSLLWRVIEREVGPTCEEVGLSQIVWSPLAQGVLAGKYRPGAPVPVGSRATYEQGGKEMVSRWLRDDVLANVQKLVPLAEQAGCLSDAWRAPGYGRTATSLPRSSAHPVPSRSMRTPPPRESASISTCSSGSTRSSTLSSSGIPGRSKA